MKKDLSTEKHHKICSPPLGADDRQNTNHFSQNEIVREDWEPAAKEAHKNRDDKVMLDFPNDFDQNEREW